MNIKRCISILCLLLLSNITQANQLYYGATFFKQKLTQKVESVSPASTTSVKDSGTGIGLYADYFHKGKYRFNSTVSYADYDNFSFVTLTAAADYLFPASRSITLFTGVTAGVGALKFNDSGLTDMSIGSLYGIELGAIAFFPNGLMLELGYRIRPASIETDILDPVTQAVIATSSVDELNETYLNLIISF